MNRLGGARRVLRIPGWRRFNRNRIARFKHLQKKVARLTPEKKYDVVAFAQNNITAAAGAISYLSALVEGANGSERIGNKVRILELAIQINTGGSGATQSLMCKTYLVRDLESNGVVPVISGTAQSIFSSFDPNTAYVNFFTKDRFKVLKTWLWSEFCMAAGNLPTYKEGRLKLDTYSYFHDATANQTAAGKHAYYLVTLTQDVVGTFDVVGAVEWTFTDV